MAATAGTHASSLASASTVTTAAQSTIFSNCRHRIRHRVRHRNPFHRHRHPSHRLRRRHHPLRLHPPLPHPRCRHRPNRRHRHPHPHHPCRHRRRHHHCFARDGANLGRVERAGPPSAPGLDAVVALLASPPCHHPWHSRRRHRQLPTRHRHRTLCPAQHHRRRPSRSRRRHPNCHCRRPLHRRPGLASHARTTGRPGWRRMARSAPA